MQESMAQIMMDLTFQASVDNDMKRENANIDADSSMGTMLKYGSENAKKFYLDNLISPDIAEAHRNGDIHIHDLDFYALTETCCQIDMNKLFENGFYSGHGFVRTPNSIASYAALACIIIQSNQNDMHGGQSIPNWEYDLAPGVSKTFKSELSKAVEDYCVAVDMEQPDLGFIDDLIANHKSVLSDDVKNHIALPKVWDIAYKRTVRATYQAMEAVVHNLNMMQSRAGSQVPFSSINLGTGTTAEQRIIIEQFLKALDAGLGNGETSIFPVVIFRVKDGINGRPEDPNYDLFKLACKVSADRMFPNFEFLDATYNKAFIKGDDPNTYVATMGCRTRVMANIHGDETTCGRGNLSFTTINLPRLGIKANGDISLFYSLLDNMLELAARQLLERFEIQSKRHVYNYPFLMKQGVWRDADKLDETDTVGEVLKHGTLTIGFIGLAECLTALIGQHHGESQRAWDLGYAIIKHMREACDKFTKQYQMNFSLLGTPAEGLCLAGDTLVQTITGNHPISEIKAGDYVFTMNENTQRIEIDKVVKAGLTSQARKVMRITFNTGQTVICTPNHPFAVRVPNRDIKTGRIICINGLTESIEWCNAENLKVGQRIKSAYLEKTKGGYLRYKNGKGYIHKMIYEYFSGVQIPKGYVVHHKNGNKLDNTFSNLECMSAKEHKILHMGKTIRKYCFTSENTRGELNPFYGKHHTDASKAKISFSKKYRTNTDVFLAECNHIVTKIEFLSEPIPVYDLTMEHNHNFFVGGDYGIMVHNSGRFVAKDKELFGIRNGITDREYYTNSSHIPVWFNCSMKDKIKKEAPFHELCNGGHICYVELDGDASKNPEALENIVQFMKHCNVGYGSINHAVDFDPVCGYRGVIGDTCPRCGRHEGEGIPIEKLKELRKCNGY